MHLENACIHALEQYYNKMSNIESDIMHVNNKRNGTYNKVMWCNKWSLKMERVLIAALRIVIAQPHITRYRMWHYLEKRRDMFLSIVENESGIRPSVKTLSQIAQFHMGRNLLNNGPAYRDNHRRSRNM